jgi:ectoine hydroxylase-related dioxygenase (phytanoyl-CoA dioxygenase family)
MMIIAPGQSEQILHRDAENWPLTKSRDDMEVTVSCMFALDDFTAENGATRVVPGSHLWDDYQSRFPAPEEVTQAVMPAGSGMIYTGKVLHGGGANVTTDVWRWGMHISFVLSWLVPEEASPLGVSWELVRDQPERIQQLLGWRCTTLGEDGVGRLWTVDYEDIPVALELE